MSRNSVLYLKCRQFASRICRLHDFLQQKKGERIISAQIVRSGTSIGANVAEALYASSRRDFINKLTISMKECSETLYWLDILNDNGYFDSDKTRSILDECEEIMKMLVASVNKLKSVSSYEVHEDFENPPFSNPLNPDAPEVPYDNPQN